MHKSASSPFAAPPTTVTKPSTPASACPYVPPENDTKTSTSTSAPSSTSRAILDKLNPLNYMPKNLSNAPAANQTISLPLEREASTIPRGDGSGNWEYPSPQQMYNAMLRKGYTDTPADAVEAMVAVHNFLNEGAWAEIVDWERRFAGGLSRGWEISRRGEENAPLVSEMLARRDRMRGTENGGTKTAWEAPRLVRFMGRPDEPTPKARMLQVMGWLYPSKFASEPPFDRHDWFVRRVGPDGQEREVRYVIDYYSGPPEPSGEPVFYLDVRPAIDGPTAAAERLVRWGGDVWWRAKGGDVREELAKTKQ